MYSNVFGIMAICENIIYGNKHTEEELEIANSIRKRIIENRKLTEKQKKFLNKIGGNR